MAIHVSLHHRTSYRYDRLVGLGPQTIRLKPAPHCRTPILSYSLKLLPEGAFVNWQQDPFSNYLARGVYPEKVGSFTVEVDLVAEMAVYNPFDFFLEPSAEIFPFAYDPSLAKDLAPYLHKNEITPQFAALLKSIDLTPQRTVVFLGALNQRLSGAIKYLIRMEPGVQTPEETLVLASGSCRDSSWLLVNLLRHVGLATRFVSGYLIQLRPDVKSIDGPSGTETDFTDLHAWCEVYLPGAGWVGLDPTSGLFAGEGHIPLACTPEPQTAAAISGSVDDCESVFEVTMKVTRLFESPRVTLPYTEETWRKIDRLGTAVDEQLARSDVRLTMGGEPTFVSLDDIEGAEWKNAAQGPTKRRLAEDLIKRLGKHYGPGGFVHYGQGKWYPGEQLPRWVFASVWRRDGQQMWKNPKLLADLGKPSSFTPKDAERFARKLSDLLGTGDKWLMPAYEDTWYYLWKERRLPTNVDPLKNDLTDKEARTDLARTFEQGLSHVVGYVLPLERGYRGDRPGWLSGPWFLRGNLLFLSPGDSPMGLRLPLDSQPWIAPIDQRVGIELDPSITLPPLEDRSALEKEYAATISKTAPANSATSPIAPPVEKTAARARHARLRPKSLPDPTTPPEPEVSAIGVVRTALCVEMRNGHIFIFIPPVQTADDYVDLLAAIEATAQAVQIPVVIEGYLPPHDHRLDSMKVTPDPGVIEVNIHPSSSWRELVEKADSLYGTARECRLGTEKFMVDGRHTGTGGGNHIVVGGATTNDSPFLRRPHLLKSLLAYWHQHPALSFLFSGLFIGPTSQAPRLDEARNDSIYELEIAFRELDRQSAKGPVPPWLVDRIFRNLLTDLTGNTHRAEFCIDKLYSPDSASGRLGLLELRGFEMPPHPRMGLTQQLLLRALISRFWEVPYSPERLVRWGTSLHDKFMLPHYCQRDFDDVISDLNGWALPFESSWLAPQFEFRFPRHGKVNYRGMEMELRHALEPWHVLGEESSAGGTARYVDSSLERVQVRVTGLVPERYIVSCNGHRVPLQPTGVNGEFVAGVRFRAWQPESCLHPTIGRQNPLIFDLVDTWNRRAIGGCTYHVAHPGGRNYDTLPVNSYEAESRRLARFISSGHTPGPLAEMPLEIAPEFPCMLDLRDPVKVAR